MSQWLAQQTEISPASQSQPERLLTTQPNFYVLGAKSYGRDKRFSMPDGYHQIREVFGIIGGRRALDLYATLRCD